MVEHSNLIVEFGQNSFDLELRADGISYTKGELIYHSAIRRDCDECESPIFWVCESAIIIIEFSNVSVM